MEKKSSEKIVSAFACGQTHAMQALTNAATAPSIAASGVFTNCATETTPKEAIELGLIKLTNAAVHLILRNLVFLFICATWIFLRVKNNPCSANK